MLRYVLQRFLWTIPQVLLVFTIVFFVMRVVAGDPTHVILGEYANAEAIRNLRKSLGLDEPLLVQYGQALVSLLQGDFGRSLINNRPIAPQVFEVLPYTLELTTAGLILGVVLGVPLGILSAVRRNSLLDSVCRVFALAGLSMPSFYLGVLLLIFFAVQWGYFPVVGFKQGASFLERMHYLCLPAFSLGVTFAAFTSRMSRSSMLERLSADYVRTARAKGLPEVLVIFKHALKDSAIPIVTVIGVYVGVHMGGSVLTEMVFNRPGLGKFLIGAIQQRDYNAIQSGLVIYAAIVVLVNLAVDLAYGLFDPRVKFE